MGKQLIILGRDHHSERTSMGNWRTKNPHTQPNNFFASLPACITPGALTLKPSTGHFRMKAQLYLAGPGSHAPGTHIPHISSTFRVTSVIQLIGHPDKDLITFI